jgi:predicted Zn-ribbon and HTH transcriptional regulator
MVTVRQKIVELLKVKPVDAGYLSRAVGASQRAIEAHLEHVAKGVGAQFEIMPSECKNCEFKFENRIRTTKPSKCPKCRGEEIYPPLFFINEKLL